MKKIIIAACLLSTVCTVFAQKEEDKEKEIKKHAFKKENLFTGGSVTAAFYNGGTILGISPAFGYSINKIIDAGLLMNFTYTGEKAYTGDRYRQYVYGPGVFTRIFPIREVFLQSTFEHNFTSVTLKPAYGGATQKYQTDANSLLVGAGYCSGRDDVGSTFFYFSVLFDVTKDPNSPYVEQLQDGSFRSQAIIKAGLQIGLFQGGSRNNNKYRGGKF